VKVLVPGGSGFLGGILTQKLLNLDIEVHIAGRSTSKSFPYAAKFSNINFNFNINNDLENFRDIYHTVIYLTGISAREALVEPEKTIEINAIVPSRILKHFANSSLNNFVYLSTHHIDALLDGTMRQSNAGPALELYAASKLSGEILLNQAAVEVSTELSHLRLPNCFGVPNINFGSDTTGSINDFCRQAATSSSIHLHAPDNQIRNFCVAETVTEKIIQTFAPDLVNIPSASEHIADYSCCVQDMAEVITLLGGKITGKECNFFIRGEKQHFDKSQTEEVVRKIPQRFVTEVESLIEFYLVSK
jgi:nucleoside-diphosphate-sugar epimerase